MKGDETKEHVMHVIEITYYMGQEGEDDMSRLYDNIRHLMCTVCKDRTPHYLDETDDIDERWHCIMCENKEIVGKYGELRNFTYIVCPYDAKLIETFTYDIPCSHCGEYHDTEENPFGLRPFEYCPNMTEEERKKLDEQTRIEEENDSDYCETCGHWLER